MSYYMDLGPVPADEECAQVGEPGYESQARREMQAYKHQLERMFPNSNFRVKWFPHDFGSYGEVCVTYIPETESEELAYKVEANIPQHWDDAARAELACPECQGPAQEVA